jgi:hypothetical protein
MMPDGSTILARATEQHCVAADHDGWIWLIWGRTRIQFHADDFCLFAEVVAAWRNDAGCARCQACGICIERAASATIQIWIVDAGLLLSPTSFPRFADMIGTAHQVLVSRAYHAGNERTLSRLYVPLRSIVPLQHSLN